MKRFVMFVAAVVAVLGRAGSAPAAGVDELPMEIATHLFDPSLIDAKLPLGPSAYRNWKSPKAPPWTFAYVGSERFGSWSGAASRKARDDLSPKGANLGLIRALILPPAAADEAEASRQIRELADRGVDAILVCCASATGLNAAIRYAHDKGALVVVLFGFSTSPWALDATTNFALEGQELAERMADDLKEKGNVLVIGGFLGSEASQALDRGIRVGLAKHAKVKLVGDIAVEGGAEAARAATQAWLKGHREPVDGIIVRAGADADILEAFSSASRKIPIMTIGDQLASLCYWRHDLDAVDRAFIGWPPAAEMALAWNVALRTLQGQGPKTQAILAESITISGFTARTHIPEDCGRNDENWFPVDDETWTSRRTLDSYFLHPADPARYTP